MKWVYFLGTLDLSEEEKKQTCFTYKIGYLTEESTYARSTEVGSTILTFFFFLFVSFPGLLVSPWTTCEERWAIQNFHFLKFHQRGWITTQRKAQSESRTSLWSMRIARQHSENSAAAQRFMGIKRHTSKRFSAKLWLWQTCQRSHQRVALRAEGRKTEDQRQEVSVSTCWFRRTPRLSVFFFCFSLVLLAYAREKKTPST